ncbi:hypothetical protein EIP86_010414 [Pleurotus ostreatoroseus]|nr:hypothetical protein EIP86_010414 [Pleurotus ostreatoroseus]
MPPISIPPLIPLPKDNHAPPDDPKDDIFATLFSPATPRPSPSTSPPSNGVTRPKAIPRHTRSASIASTDSDFGSFVSVPSQEDPLSQFVSSSDSVPFTPLQNFEFFEDAKVAQEKNKKGVLEELLNHDADPLYFLRSPTPTSAQDGVPALLPPEQPASSNETRSQVVEAANPTAADELLVPVDPLPASDVDQDMLDFLSMSVEARRATTPTLPNGREPPLLTPSPPSRTDAKERLQPARAHVLDELLAHQDDPLYFHTPGTLTASPDIDGSRATTPQPISRSTSVSGEELLVELETPVEGTSWHPRSRSEAQHRHHSRSRSTSPTSPIRSPSLPPPPLRISKPEVQRTQSYFTPSSFTTASTFPTRWVSSLLSRAAPPPPPPPVHAETEPVISASVSRTQVTAPITHGTPFAAHPYVPPSGAPGFAGDRAWNKGFEFDKENVERVSVRLVGRKESTTPVLSVGIADKVGFLGSDLEVPRIYRGALLIVRDSNEAVFGAWMGEGIKMSKGSYYGSGESFLWRITPDNQLRVFKWSGKNDYVALCESEYISFGGGDGHYGLYLDDTLSDGSSARCPTFDNEPLCSPGPRQGEAITFECVGLEVWGVG